jgi:hypothetical protein
MLLWNWQSKDSHVAQLADDLVRNQDLAAFPTEKLRSQFVVGVASDRLVESKPLILQ